MTFLEGQIEVRKAHILRAHAEIISGAYKSHYILVTHEDGQQHKLSDPELLDRAIDTMNNHIRLLGELADNLPLDVKE